MDIDHKRLSVGIFRCVPFYKVYRSDPTLPVCRELLSYSCCVYSPRFGVSERLVFKSAVLTLSPIIPSGLNF